MSEVVVANLTKEQIDTVVGSRRSLPIPSMVSASSKARGLLLRQPQGHQVLLDAENNATRVCREAGVTNTFTLITFQVSCSEYAIGQSTKEQISVDDYDLLTFAIRSALDRDSVPVALRQHLANIRVPEEVSPVPKGKPAPKPSKPDKRGAFGNRPSSAAGRKRAQAAPAKAAPKPAKAKTFKVKQSTLDEARNFLND